MDKHVKIAILGCGNMGEAFLKLLVEQGFSNLIASVKSLEKKNKLEENYSSKVALTTNNQDLQNAEILFLGVKPQILPQLDFTASPDQLIVSMLAKTSTKEISQKLQTEKVMRIMPNMGMLAGNGITGIFLNDQENETVNFILEKSGLTVKLESEDQLDAFTVFSGCGPGFIYYFLECLENAAANLGIKKEDIKKVAAKLLTSSATALAAANISAAAMKEKVASKGGLTEAGLKCFEEMGLQNICNQALEKAKNKKI
jgi:pyrroline-5-carboxylate reductase